MESKEVITQIEATALKLRRVYCLQLIVHIILLIGVLVLPTGILRVEAADQVALQSLLTLYTLGAIPCVLKLFQRAVMRISAQQPIDAKLKRYAFLFHCRWLVLGSIVWFDFAAYLCLGIQSYLLLGAIGLVSLLFCNTSSSAIEKDLQ